MASGVPALVLFSIGGITGTTGKLAFLVWAVSMVKGFVQSFTYAEIAGLFPMASTIPLPLNETEGNDKNSEETK